MTSRTTSYSCFLVFLMVLVISAFTSYSRAQNLDNVENLDWEQAKVHHTVESYNTFLSKYPNGKFSSKARIRLEELDWNKAKTSHTTQSFDVFLSKHPTGRYTDEAIQIRKALENGVVYKGISKCKGLQIEVLLVYDAATSTIGYFSAIHSPIRCRVTSTWVAKAIIQVNKEETFKYTDNYGRIVEGVISPTSLEAHGKILLGGGIGCGGEQIYEYCSKWAAFARKAGNP